MREDARLEAPAEEAKGVAPEVVPPPVEDSKQVAEATAEDAKDAQPDVVPPPARPKVLDGWLTRQNKPCQWLMPCSVHANARAAELRKDNRCSEPTRAGGAWTQQRPCPWHATDATRCFSTLMCKPGVQCKLVRVEGQQYCAKHAAYPDFGKRLLEFALQRPGTALTLKDFIVAAFPTATAPARH